MNELSVNVSKTKFILFNTKLQTPGPILKLILNDLQIEQASNIKFLGVTIEKNLSWEKHITQKSNKISQINAILSRLKSTLSKNILEVIYKSLIEPHLHYGIIAWGNTPNKYMKRLKVLQKRSMRLIDKSKYNSHTDPIFKRKNLLKVEDIFKLNCCKFYYKKLKGTLPQYHTNLLLTFSENRANNQQARTTRQENNIYIHPIRTQLDKQSINYTIGNIWNNLPKTIKDNHSLTFSSFCKNIKSYYICTYQTTCTNTKCFVCNRI